MSIISVIVPIYNVEKYLDKCLNSIRNQTYQKLEIILVNDGSPDGSSEIMEKHKKDDDRIKIINKKNGGLSSARNAGIEVSTGDYLAFIDSDDWIDLDMMEKLHTSIVNQKSDVAVCDVRTEYENGELKAELKQGVEFSDVIEVNEHPDAYMSFDCFACNKLYKRELFVDQNISFPEGLLYEDIATFPRIFARISKISLVREQLYHYIVRSGAITQTFKLKGLDYLKVTEIVENDYKKLNNKQLLSTLDAFKITHNFYSLSINCCWIPITEDRNLAINTLKSYIKNQKWTWKQVKNAGYANTTFLNKRSKAQRMFYFVFWHCTSVLKIILSIFHKIKS